MAALSWAIAVLGQASSPQAMPGIIIGGSPLHLESGGIPSILADLMSMRSNLMQLAPRPVRSAPANPCAEDIRRLKCSDSACLKRATETLAPACAAFLLGSPEPSPAPQPPTRTVAVRSSSERQPQGFFSITSTSADGAVHRTGGPLSALASASASAPPRSSVISTRQQVPSRPMSVSMPPSLNAMLTSILPPELVPIFAGLEIEEEEEEEDDEPRHPCEREINACTHEMGDRSTSAIQQCLLRHVDQLSDECKCFVHHVTASRSPAPSAASAAGHMAAVRTAPVVSIVPQPTTVVIEEQPSAAVAYVEEPRHHRLSCLIVFTLLFLLSFLLARACFILCCCRGAARRRVVVVPPEQAVIKTVSTPAAGPILITEIVQEAVPVKGKVDKA